MTEHDNKYKHLQQLIDDLSSMKDDLSKKYNELRVKINAIPIPTDKRPNKKYDLAETFIGYGNPDADILIVGKECAYDLACDLQKKDFEKFCKSNFEQWKKSFAGHGFVYTDGTEEGKEYSYENNAFHPLFPFYWQCNNLKNICPRSTNSTYYYYQMLIDKIRAEIEGKYVKSECVIVFQKVCLNS